MRRLWLPALLAVLTVGCDETGTSETQDSDRFARMSYSTDERSVGSPIETVLKDAPRSNLGAPVSDEGADRYRGFFDGDTRKGGFNQGVSAGAADWTPSRRQTVKLSAPRKNTLKIDDVPPPNSLPGVDLPDAQPGTGVKGGGETLVGFDNFQRSMNDFIAPLLSRVGWGAAKRKGPPMRHNPYRVTVHHTMGGTSHSESETIRRVRGVQHYHMVGRGAEGKDTWDDIGYHFLIDSEGRVVEGRPAEILGAHAGGANDGNIGIALIGDFNKTQPSQAQIRSLERLVVYLAIKYRRDPSHKGFLQPHQHFNSTDCPGKNLMAILDTIRADVDRQANEAIARLNSGFADGFTPVVVAKN